MHSRTQNLCREERGRKPRGLGGGRKPGANQLWRSKSEVCDTDPKARESLCECSLNPNGNSFLGLGGLRSTYGVSIKKLST